jgi:hypothetical protein
MKEAKELSNHRYARILNSQKFDFDESPQRKVMAINVRNARTIYPTGRTHSQLHNDNHHKGIQ